jgi:hypothetical protein
MSPAPFVAFVVAGLFMVVSEKLYFQALSDRGLLGVRDDRDWSADVYAKPSRLPWIVASQTRLRLRALVTRQAEPSVERRRLFACASAVAAIAAFAWVVVS